MKKIFKFVGIFGLLLIIFNLLLLLSSLFPSDLIEGNVLESSKILTSEGNEYKFFQFYDVRNNNYTDSLIINEAYSIDNTNPIYSYLSARKNYKSDQTNKVLNDNLGEATSINNSEKYDPIKELDDFLNGNIDISVKYARYWHGYLAIIRPLLIFFNISQIRTILLIVFIVLFLCLIYLLYNKLGVRAAIIYTIALILEDYFFVSYSLESAPVFIVMMIACIILLKKLDKFKDWYIFIFITSCVTNFVDFLTVPLITLAMPLYIYILYNQKNNKFTWKYSCTLIIKSSLIWFLGYALTWLSKWIIYDLIYNESLIKSALRQVVYRSSRTNPLDNISIYGQIFMMLLNKFVCIIPILVIFIYSCQIYKIEKKVKFKLIIDREHLKLCLPLLLISLLPFMWYVALANHTILHDYFVYRHLLIFFAGLFLCINNMLHIQKQNIETKEINSSSCNSKI